MIAPTAQTIIDWSQLNFGRYGYADASRLQVVVDRAVGYVVSVTGQDLAAPELTMNLTETMFESLMGQAIQMRVEQAVLQGRKGHLDSAASNEVVSSFSAGSYTESRRDPAKRGEQRSINTWPALDELLWMLMTVERYDFWIAYIGGKGIPDFVVQQMDWRGLGTAVTFYEPWDTYLPASYDAVM